MVTSASSRGADAGPLPLRGCSLSSLRSLDAARRGRGRSRGGPQRPSRGAMIRAGEEQGAVQVAGAAATVTSASSSGADACPLRLRGCRSSLRSLDASRRGRGRGRGRSRGGPRRPARSATIRAGEVEGEGAAATVTSTSSSGGGAGPLRPRGCRSSSRSRHAAGRRCSRGGPRRPARCATIRAGEREVEEAAATATSAASSGADGRGPLRRRGCPSCAASSRHAARRSPRGAQDATIPAGAVEGGASGRARRRASRARAPPLGWEWKAVASKRASGARSGVLLGFWRLGRRRRRREKGRRVEEAGRQGVE